MEISAFASAVQPAGSQTCGRLSGRSSIYLYIYIYMDSHHWTAICMDSHLRTAISGQLSIWTVFSRGLWMDSHLWTVISGQPSAMDSHLCGQPSLHIAIWTAICGRPSIYVRTVISGRPFEDGHFWTAISGQSSEDDHLFMRTVMWTGYPEDSKKWPSKHYSQGHCLFDGSCHSCLPWLRRVFRSFADAEVSRL